MSDSYLLGVQIQTPKGRLVDNGILQVGTDFSLKLINPKMKGTALGGLLLVALWAVIIAAITSPFIFFHVAPITQWDALSASLYALLLPVGLIATFYFCLGFSRRIQVKYPKSVRNIKVLDSKFDSRLRLNVLELDVEADNQRLVLVATGFSGKTARAMAYLQA